MPGTDLKVLLKRIVELVMPDLRAYYRVVRKAKVVKTYASDGRYWADVQPLRNDDSVDPNEPVIPKVEIPVIWAGPKRGVVCPPTVGSYCDLSYYDGDPNYPRISNFRWEGNKAPAIGIGGFIIQLDPTNYIKIDPTGKHITLTQTDKEDTVGGNWAIQVTGIATVQAPQINLNGKLSATNSAPGGEAVFDNPSFETKGGDVKLASQGIMQKFVTEDFLDSKYDLHSHYCPTCGGTTNPPDKLAGGGNRTSNVEGS